MEDTVTIQRCHSHLIIPKARYNPNKHVLVEEVKSYNRAPLNVNSAQNLNNVATWKGKTPRGYKSKHV